MQRAVSPQRLATAADAGLPAREIAVRYVAAPVLVLVIKHAQSSAITIVRTNALDVNGHAQMIARQDAKRIAFRHAQQIVRTPAQTAQADAETVAFACADDCTSGCKGGCNQTCTANCMNESLQYLVRRRMLFFMHMDLQRMQ